MKAPLYNLAGKEVGNIEISDAIFAHEWNADLVHQAILAGQANQRRPWAHAKGRGEVRGGGKKPWRQKGTGRARHGSIRSPIWKGGGASHGPVKDRNFSQKLNKKMVRAALHAVLSKKLADGQLKFVDALTSTDGKTKAVAGALQSFVAAKKQMPSTLLIRDSKNALIIRAARNIDNVEILSGDSMNVYDLMKAKHVLVEQAAVTSIK